MSVVTPWDRIKKVPHHGINIPLFAVRSQQSCGIGEYLDLLPIISWCKSIGFDVIQTLPLNDLGHETSPYSALSAFALNPLHLSLSQLPEVQGDARFEEQLKAMQAANEQKRVDYPTVQKTKERFLNTYLAEHGAELEASAGYRRFTEANPWLEPYAAYKALKEANDWRSWDNWTVREGKQSSYYKILQYLCFSQMERVLREGEKQGVWIKGDIPILINRDSVEVWHTPQYFNLAYSAGAPPDMYAEEGQKWGFPLYRWEEIEKDHNAWWKQRLEAASRIYHIYRLDHILGFFRIWAVPESRTAKEGFYIPDNMPEALHQGERILRQLLEATTMLPIGEDLGNVPTEVRTTMANLEICGTKVMRWERRWNTDRGFIDPCDYQALSMTTVSTHDSETLREWWQNQTEEAKEFAAFKQWNYSSELTVEQQKEILRDSHKSGSLFHINLLQEYLTLFPELRWPSPEEERINVPGIVDEQNWTYKYKPSIEEWTQHPKLAELMRALIS